jgi:hypothetical protein
MALMGAARSGHSEKTVSLAERRRASWDRQTGLSERGLEGLVTILGLVGLRIFETAGADISDLGEEHGHRVLRVCGKGAVVLHGMELLIGG